MVPDTIRGIVFAYPLIPREGQNMQNIQNMMLATYARMKSDEGASMVEYALLVVLIAIVAIVAIRLTGQGVDNAFENVQTNLNNAAN